MTYEADKLNLNKIKIYKNKFKLATGYSNHFNKKEIFYSLSAYNPDSIFLYCKPVKKRGRIYPDDQHAFYLDELEKIKSSYNLSSEMHSFDYKKKTKINIFKNGIKF